MWWRCDHYCVRSSFYDAVLLIQEQQTRFVYSESSADQADNYMDRWIVSFTQSLAMYVRQEMQGYFSLLPHL